MATAHHDNGVLSLFLGPESSHVGTLSQIDRAIFVDFASDIRRDLPKQVDLDTAPLWEGQVDRISKAGEPPGTVDIYNPNPSLHWSELGGYSERRTVELGHSTQFGSFHSGRMVWEEQGLGEVLEEKSRYEIEQIDTFSGLTLVLDREGGWSGVVSALMPLLDDCYGTRPKFALSLGTSCPGLFEFESLTSNTVCSFIDTSKLKGQGLLNKDTVYHRSALLSLFLRQCDASYSASHFKDFLTYLSPLSRTLIGSFLGVPFDSLKHGQAMDALLQPDVFQSLITPISLYAEQVSTPLHLSYLAIAGLEGVPSPTAFFSSLTSILPTSPLLGSSTRYCYSGTGQTLPPLFPQFFGAKILANGRLKGPHEKSRSKPVTELPTAMLLQNSKLTVEQLINKVSSEKVAVLRSPELLSAGILQEDVSDIMQRVLELRENFDLE